MSRPCPVIISGAVCRVFVTRSNWSENESNRCADVERHCLLKKCGLLWEQKESYRYPKAAPGVKSRQTAGREAAGVVAIDLAAACGTRGGAAVLRDFGTREVPHMRKRHLVLGLLLLSVLPSLGCWGRRTSNRRDCCPPPPCCQSGNLLPATSVPVVAGSSCCGT